MRREIFLAAALIACRSQPDPAAVTPIPLPSPLPLAVADAGASTPSAQPKRICEPTVSCGFWSKCKWLELDRVEPAGYPVYRVEGTDAGGSGAQYRRMHRCWPEDAGPDRCALYCVRKGECVDALTSDVVCTRSGPPRPSPFGCEVRGNDCVTLP